MRTEQVMEEIIHLIKNLFDDHGVNIIKAYQKNENDLTVNLSVKFSQGASPNMIDAKATLSFTADKVKDEAEVTIDTTQGKLFEAKV